MHRLARPTRSRATRPAHAAFAHLRRRSLAAVATQATHQEDPQRYLGRYPHQLRLLVQLPDDRLAYTRNRPGAPWTWVAATPASLHLQAARKRPVCRAILCAASRALPSPPFVTTQAARLPSTNVSSLPTALPSSAVIQLPPHASVLQAAGAAESRRQQVVASARRAAAQLRAPERDALDHKLAASLDESTDAMGAGAVG